MKMKNAYIIKDIDWDIDEYDNEVDIDELPDLLITNTCPDEYDDEFSDNICEKLESITGFCVKGFNYDYSEEFGLENIKDYYSGKYTLGQKNGDDVIYFSE